MSEREIDSLVKVFPYHVADFIPKGLVFVLGSLAKTFLVLCESQSAIVMDRRQGDLNNNPQQGGPVAVNVHDRLGPPVRTPQRPDPPKQRSERSDSSKRSGSTPRDAPSCSKYQKR